ncbi:MAG: fibronectin type III domain-containing protein [Pyrinomonadaceae bacterium]|nr:fibronectin type III domain-containing protein [Pyrinomonadaceae bacterium]
MATQSSARVVPTNPESACTGAGITVLTDVSGDALTQQASHDIRSVDIAEPFFADGSNKLVFTIKVSDLSGPLTPNTQWRIYFTGPDNNGYFVDMRTELTGAVSFKHGTYIHNADNTQGTATTLGDADAGSRYDTQTDAITIVVSNSKIGNPQPGARLSRIFVRVPLIAIVPDNANYASPSSEVGYTLVGNAACQPKPAAAAALIAVNTGKGRVALYWADRSDNEDHFLVERSTSVSSGFIQLGTSPANMNTYTDATAFRRKTYYYRVRAENGGGKSGYSNVVSIPTK